jgi:hypothetical protein
MVTASRVSYISQKIKSCSFWLLQYIQYILVLYGLYEKTATFSIEPNYFIFIDMFNFLTNIMEPKKLRHVEKDPDDDILFTTEDTMDPQALAKEKLSALEPCKGPGIRIVCISDTHAKHGRMLPLPEGDVLIHGGDFTNTGSRRDTEDFVMWMDAQPFKYKVFIAGNHDTSLHTSYYVERGAERFHRGQKDIPPAEYSVICRDVVHSCASTYLEDSATTISFEVLSGEQSSKAADGNLLSSACENASVNKSAKTDAATEILAADTDEPSQTPVSASTSGRTEVLFDIYGSPWQPEFCDWAFNLDRGEPCASKWAAIPDGLDVLITHGPPYGYGDKTIPSGMRVGCEDMLKKIKGSERPPRVHIFGHIHEDEGK